VSSLATDGTAVVATSDSYGRAALARMQFPNSGDNNNLEEDGGGFVNCNKYNIMGVEQLNPVNLSTEAGWTGVALAPDQPSQVAIARHFTKDITLFDGPMAVRTIHTTYRPNAVQLLSSNVATDAEGGPLVAVAEGPVISIWDVRAAGRGARIARLSSSPHSGPFYCLAASSNGGVPLLGAAGSERSVLIWDPRTWRTIDRWNNCLKYEATSLQFLSSNPSYCVVCGLDYEVVCGKWGGDRKNRIGGGHRTATNGGGAADGDKNCNGGLSITTAAVDNSLTDNHTTRIQSTSTSKSSNISFRGDSRWMGLAKAHGKDIVAGMTESKQLYVAELTAAL
jgi:WD40 repeat protein